MYLLVSVTNASEAVAALAGGAEILDAKDPKAGPIGAIGAAALRDLCRLVPPAVPLSAALGDIRSPEDLRRSLQTVRGVALAFVKLGFCGVEAPAQAATFLAATVEAVSTWPDPPAVVAVAYADWQRARAVEPRALLAEAVQAGAHGVLLDTAVKDGVGLLELWEETRLGDWIGEAHAGGLFAALGGGLTRADLEKVQELGADIAGVRGAACEGGRTGRVSTQRVSALRRELDRVRPPYDAGLPFAQARPVARSSAPMHRLRIPIGSARVK
ncbi:MAG: (5-formylfuran-3-yl)methyl phosphate synthase [Gemmatimonadales bacterium]